MTQNDWQSPEAYDYVHELSPARLAFEFLRRNANYRNDFRNACNEAALGDGAEAVAPNALALRWGMTFSGRSECSRRPAIPVLEPGSRPQYRRSD